MKGGVGKTTLAAQLAHPASSSGLETLAVDLDPQSNLSQSLLTPERWVEHLRAIKPTLASLFEQYLAPTDEALGACPRIPIFAL